MSYVEFKNHSIVEDINHGQSRSLMATTRMETTHGLFSGKSDNVTSWQSVNVVRLGCLTHGACVGHWTPDYGAMGATGSACKRRWLKCYYLSM